MDISQVTDLSQLKALAYDTLQAIEAQQTNLRLLQQRITQLQQEPQPQLQPQPQPLSKK